MSTPLQHQAAPTRTRSVAVAQVVTDTLAPIHIAITNACALAINATSWLHGLAWGALAAIFIGIVPALFVQRGIRRGRWADRHISERQKRPVAIVFAGACVMLGIGVLHAAGAPRDLIVLIIAQLTGMVVALFITLAWKISIHAATAFGSVPILVMTFGPWLGLTALIAILIGWSRITLRAHTLAQVIAGGALGASVAWVVYATLR